MIRLLVSAPTPPLSAMPDLELGAGADTMLTGKQIIPATGAHLKSAATDTLSRKLAGMPKASC